MAHALRNPQTFTVGDEFHRCKQASLNRMKRQVRRITSGGADCFIKSADRKIRCDWIYTKKVDTNIHELLQ